MSADRGAWIKIVTGNIGRESDQNKLAIRKLVEGEKGKVIRSRLRILIGNESPSILFHSKMIVVDSKSGYLGSANITFHAFERNFEVGVALSVDQSSSIEFLVAFWESSGMLLDSTAVIFS